MERGLEEASVRGKNGCQVKLVDTEKGGLGVISEQGCVRVFYSKLKSGSLEEASLNIMKMNQGSAESVTACFFIYCFLSVVQSYWPFRGKGQS